MFEMDKEQVGPFLNLAFSSLNEKHLYSVLTPRLTRMFNNKWPRKKRERFSLSFYSDGGHKDQLDKKQIKTARKYFQRLAEKTAQVM